MKLFSLLLTATGFLLCEAARMKIINGRIADANSWPYMALIEYENENGTLICGGSLINESWVLTAAHCDIKLTENNVIYLGAHSRETKTSSQQEFNVIRVVKHNDYNDNTFNADLQLLKLSDPAKLNDHVKVLPLPQSSVDPEGKTVCETAGWGFIKNNGPSSEDLMEVSVTVLNRKDCSKRGYKITNNMICTNVGPNGQDTCSGDSGGPLICNGVFSGVTSFGPPTCGQPGKASVFTRLTQKYINWIKSEIKK